MIAFLVTVLVNAAWQPAVIALITWIALRVSRCTNATTRHAVWTLALIASVCVPVVSAAPLLLPQPPPAAATHVASQPANIVSKKTAPVHASVPAPTAPVFPLVRRPTITLHPTVASIVAAVWAVVALAVLARLAISFFYLERLKRDALPLPVDRRHALSRWERAEKGQGDVRICVTGETRVPVAIGIFDAMILLPQDLVEELDPVDLDRILLHELAHIRRSDDWVNLFERIAMALLFFSPGMYFIARQMDLEREVACDDWVLTQAAENASYARCLARIVEMTQWPYRALAAPGVFVTRRSMSIRIERLLARGRDVRIRLAVVPSIVSLLAIGVIVVAGGFVSPTIAYTMSSDVAIHPVHLKPTVVAAKPSPRATATVKAKPTAVATPTPSPLIAAEQPAKLEVRTQVRAHAAMNSPVVALAIPSPRMADPAHSMDNTIADTGYLDELRDAGLTNLDADTVIALKSVGVTGDYIRAMRNAGIGPLSGRQLVELKSVGVTPDYVRAMRNAGLSASDPRGWSEMKSVGVTPDLVAALERAGVTGLDARSATEVTSVGVTPQYVQDLANAGYSKLSARQYTELKSVGVDGAYIAHLAQRGFSKLPVEKLIEFKSMGIDPK